MTMEGGGRKMEGIPKNESQDLGGLIGRDFFYLLKNLVKGKEKMALLASSVPWGGVGKFSRVPVSFCKKEKREIFRDFKSIL